MTYFKLHLKRIVALLIVVVFMLITYGILGYFYHELTIVFPLFFLSAILLMDGFVIYRFKGDLFDEKYKGGVSYYAFKFFIYADFIIGVPLLIASFILCITLGIGTK
jgi:hypothetical protein